MIELTLAQLRDQQFISAIEKVMNSTQMPFKSSYHFSRIGQKIRSEARDAHDQFVKLVRKYGEVDDKTGSFKIKEENVANWDRELKELNEIKVSIDKNKMAMSELSKVTLSPADILALEPILYGLDIIEGGTNEKRNEEKAH